MRPVCEAGKYQQTTILYQNVLYTWAALSQSGLIWAKNNFQTKEDKQQCRFSIL
jgi:hypothetical protein